jgi:uncharacterized protein YdeI (YjbR/CyaY-like superfamily)
MTEQKTTNLPIILFTDQPAFEAWLNDHQSDEKGVLVKIAKKDQAPAPSIMIRRWNQPFVTGGLIAKHIPLTSSITCKNFRPVNPKANGPN